MRASGKHLGVVAVALLMAAGAVHAQGRGGGGGGGRGQRGGGNPSPSPSSTPSNSGPAPRPNTPANQVDILGVVQAVGPGEDRVTISYDAVEALNWPAGSNSFVVAKTEMLKGIAPGQKVRFRIDSQTISALTTQ